MTSGCSRPRTYLLLFLPYVKFRKLELTNGLRMLHGVNNLQSFNNILMVVPLIRIESKLLPPFQFFNWITFRMTFTQRIIHLSKLFSQVKNNEMTLQSTPAWHKIYRYITYNLSLFTPQTSEYLCVWALRTIPRPRPKFLPLTEHDHGLPFPQSDLDFNI